MSARRSKSGKSKSSTDTPPDTSQQVLFIARDYADAHLDFPVERRDIDTHVVRWSSGSHFQMGHKIGAGFFGEVCAAVDKRTNENVVIKVLKVDKKEKVKLRREIKMLEEVRGGTNIVRLISPIRDSKTGKKGLVFERIDYVSYRELYPELTELEVRYYAYQLLLAIDHTHSIGVLHRDIKPSNVLIDPRHHKLLLIDWGVAGFYVPTIKNARGPGTRCYKAPELCLRYDYYDYGVDMWAYGCTLGSLMFLEHPLIRGKGSWYNQLLAITKVVGSEDLFAYMDKLKIKLTSKQVKGLNGYRKKEWNEWVTAENEHRVTPEGLDLISKLVVCDHTQRLTSREALEHPYFDPVRDGLSMYTEYSDYDDEPDDDDGEYSYYSYSLADEVEEEERVASSGVRCNPCASGPRTGASNSSNNGGGGGGGGGRGGGGESGAAYAAPGGEEDESSSSSSAKPGAVVRTA